MENVSSTVHLLHNNFSLSEQEFHSKDNLVSFINNGYSSTSLLSKSNKECERVERVSILAFHHKPLYHECIVLVQEYRAHLRNYTIEMPTGLVENNESPEVSAVRILSEQTGYTGYVKTVGPLLTDSPSYTSQYSRIISMRIDGNDVRNLAVKSSCTCDTNSKVILVPVEELLDKLIGFTQSNYFIDSKIDAFAIGLVKGNSSKKNKYPRFYK